MYLSKITIGTAVLLSTILSTTTAFPLQDSDLVPIPRGPHTPIVNNPPQTPDNAPPSMSGQNGPPAMQGSDAQPKEKRDFFDDLFAQMQKP
ncbi:MAG: hypothetical protein Q9226_002833, partial [Calogaya cf. arnoldii]